MGWAVCKYSIPCGDFSFHPLNSIFRRTGALSSNEAQFDFFSFTGCGFSIVSNKSSPDAIHKDFFLRFIPSIL